MDVRCRDCGEMGDEDPNDPAPAICPSCYDKRLARVFAEVGRVLEEQHDMINPFEICRVFEEQLIEVGDETPEFARTHAKTMLMQMLFGEIHSN